MRLLKHTRLFQIHIGNLVHTDNESDIDDLVLQTKHEMQRLIDKYQPSAPGKNYWRGIRQRLDEVLPSSAFRSIEKL